MQYRKLGNTDLNLSVIGLGTMTWGEQNTQSDAFEQMDYALENGVNFIDVAEMYPVPPRPETCGASETIVGSWLAKRGVRERMVVATKVTGRSDRNGGTGHVRDGARLSREHILQAVDGSLTRLRTDRIDLYQIHWPERRANFFGQLGYEHVDDDGISIAETLDALEEVVRSGKVRYIGISNETPWGMMEYLRLHWLASKPKIQSIQNPYSLLNRSFEIGCAEVAIREQVSGLAYSPLAFGMLSGKYRGGVKPEGARLTLFERFQRYSNQRCQEATEAYYQLAEESGFTLAQMALAFVHSRPFITSNIIGATQMDQLRENIRSVEVELPGDLLQKLNDIHRQYPNPAP